MNLDQAIKTDHLIWLVGEPVIGMRMAQHALYERESAAPVIWTIATGKGSQWGSGKSKQDRVAEQELIDALLDAGAGETLPGSGNFPPGLVVLAEGLRFGGHIQAAALKVISGDGKVVFVSSGEPPENFLKDYLRVVEQEYTDLETDLRRLFEGNEREYRDELVSPLRGLRPYRAASIAAESIAVRDSGDELPYIYERRGEAIRSDSHEIITFVEPQTTFSDLIGLNRAKRLLKALVEKDPSDPVRGVLYIGIPGVGKTALAMAAAGESGLPLYIMDVGAVFNALVGESEARVRRALSVLRNVPTGILLLDEVEKSLSGSKSGQSESSSTFTRVGMYFLKYLEYPKSSNGFHLVIGTSNDIFSLPPEFTRAGRWDAVFAFLRPREVQLRQVLEMYRSKYELGKGFGARVGLDGFTPAEVEATCRIAAILGTNDWGDAVQYVPVLYKFRREDVERIEAECRGRAVSADEDDPLVELGKKEPTRKVRR